MAVWANLFFFFSSLKAKNSLLCDKQKEQANLDRSSKTQNGICHLLLPIKTMGSPTPFRTWHFKLNFFFFRFLKETCRCTASGYIYKFTWRRGVLNANIHSMKKKKYSAVWSNVCEERTPIPPCWIAVLAHNWRHVRLSLHLCLTAKWFLP